MDFSNIANAAESLAANTIKGQAESLTSNRDIQGEFTSLLKKRSTGKLSDAEMKQYNEIIKLLKDQNKLTETSWKLDRTSQKAYTKMSVDQFKQQMKQWTTTGSILKGISTGLTNMFNRLDKHIQLYSQYSIRTQAALEGTQTTYRDAVSNLTQAIGGTGLAQMSDVLANMNQLTSQGIVANVEQRAFLASVKDGIASTFNVADSTMMRLIKLQGEDSTANRLVMQASLKEYLNSNYQNSQYLIEQYRQVSDSLVEATSLLTNSLSLSLESTVQKWMGSLSSLGLSDKAVQSLAQAIGYVGSGDLSGISSSGMQNLVIMGANRAGLSYGDLLTGGLTAEQTNALMTGMLQQLGSMSGNNVVMSEYAKLLGVSVSDLKVARQAASELEKISNTVIDTTERGLSKYLKKYNEYLNNTPSVLYDNLFSNRLFGMGMNVASTRLGYGSFKVGNLVTKLGSMIPGKVGDWASVLGTAMQLGPVLGVDLNRFVKGDFSGLKNAFTAITSLKNLVRRPDSEKAYEKLAGVSLAQQLDVLSTTSEQMLEAAKSVGKKATDIDAADVMSAAQGLNRTAAEIGAYKTTSASTSLTGESAYKNENIIEINIDDAFAALEEAQAARTADDIFEFLSDDVVTVTPFVNEGDTLSQITSYNKVTAESTANILQILKDVIEGKVQLINISIPSSMLAGTNGDLNSLLAPNGL